MSSMILGFVSWVQDFVTELVNLIPKIVYMLYASLACVLDVLQLFFRKLAGLDVYYVDGVAVSGDLVTNFIGGILGFTSDGFSYSALSTVFWAFIVFGIIMIFVTTIVAIVKSHYSYDDKAAKGPMQYVYTAGKAVINIAAVPIIVFLGLYLSQAILTALDGITTSTNSSVVSIYGTDESGEQSLAERYLRSTSTSATGGDETYIYYDIFGYASSIRYSDSQNPDLPSDNDVSLIGAANITFSGSLFKLAAYNANRARQGDLTINSNFTGSASSDIPLCGNARTNDELADMIDVAFANNLHLREVYTFDYSENDVAARVLVNMFFTNGIGAFSKFNIGAVWYYYDLWQFNAIVGFAACLVCAVVFINIIMSLAMRLFMCIGLFLVAPPLFGLAPLDGGKAGKSWTESFMKQVLMAYGAVVGMNLFFLILPYINEIDFFNIAIADLFAQTIIIIVGLITVKTFIAMISGFVGGEDANRYGSDVGKEVGKVTAGAVGLTGAAVAGTAKMIGAPVVGGARAAYHGVRGAVQTGKQVAANIEAKKAEKKQQQLERDAQTYDKINEWYGSINGKEFTDKEFIENVRGTGLSRKEAKAALKEIHKTTPTLKTNENGKRYKLYRFNRDNLMQNANLRSLKMADDKGEKQQFIDNQSSQFQNRIDQQREKADLHKLKAQQRYRKAGHAAGWGIGTSLGSAWSLAWSNVKNAEKTLRGHEGIDEFAKKTYAPSKDHQAETAANTEKSAESAARSANSAAETARMQELILRQMGASQKEIDDAKDGKRPKE